MKRILVVDDDQQIIRVLSTALRSGGYQVESASNGLEAYALVEKSVPDMVITDLAMPEMNGLELTEAVRRIAKTPILVLSVRSTEQMKVKALDAGADDFLTKPFGMAELLARVRAHLRRNEDTPAEEEHFAVGAFHLDDATHTITLRGVVLNLTPKEFELLALLMRNGNRVMRHPQLLRTLWGPGFEDQPHHLRVLIGQLRKKLDQDDGAVYITSEPWIGYRFHPDGTSADAQL